MLYTCTELLNKLGSFAKINTAVKKGRYSKISRGIYSDESPFISDLENIFAQYPNAILTLESAFAHYDLTDYIPDKYYIATSQKAHKINNPKVKQIYITDSILNIGKVVVETEYGKINIYDRERMLIELFRLKSKLSYALFKEVVKSYRELAKNGEIDIHKLMNYCSQFKNGSNIESQILDIVL